MNRRQRKICNQTEEWQRLVHEPEEREEEVKEGQTRATDNANSVLPTPTVCVEVKEDNIGISINDIHLK